MVATERFVLWDQRYSISGVDRERGGTDFVSKTADNRPATPSRKISLGQGLSGANLHSPGVVLAPITVSVRRSNDQLYACVFFRPVLSQTF